MHRTLLLAALLAASGAAPAEPGRGWAVALAEAKARGLPVLVHAWAPW